MRSANKKHGNIGDVEVTVGRGTLEILEAWDAKYGKPYLRDELEELNEKLFDHMETQLVGFVVDREPLLKDEIVYRMRDIEEIHQVQVKIQSFDEWAEQQLAVSDEEADALARDWLVAFSESLGQRRRELAPIDEPSDTWVRNLSTRIQQWKQKLR